MSDTTFVAGTVVAKEWLNDVNDFVYGDTHVNVHWYGAVGDGTTDDTAAFVAALATGKYVVAPMESYKITAPLAITEGGIIGGGYGIGGVGAQFTILTFYNCTSTTNGVIYTRKATQKSNFIRLENLYIQSSSWDGTTGCLGYGLDIEAPVLIDNITVTGFKKSGVFLHQNTAGTGGPYGSKLQNVRSVLNGQHGFLVGAGANAFSIGACEAKWSGTPTFNTTPSVAGNYDGLHIENTADGNGYASFIPTSVVVIGGDFSYNSRYGIHVVDANGGQMGGSYAEGNLSADTMQHCAGAGMNRGQYDFGFAVAGSGDLIKINTVDTALAQTCLIKVNGYDYGGASNVAQTIMYDKQLSTADGRTRQLYLGADDVGATNATIIQAATDGNAYYYGQGTGRHIFSAGLKVGNVAQADVAVLDWYEEGTFTPAIVGTGTAGTGTYTYQVGRFQRIGNRVNFSISLVWTAHTGTTNMVVSGLPYTSANINANMSWACSSAYALLAIGAGKELGATVNNASSSVTLYAQDQAGGAIAALPIDAAGSLYLSGSYEV